MESPGRISTCQSRSTMPFFHPRGVPYLLLCVIIATGINNSFANARKCNMPSDLLEAMQGALQLKLNPNESIARPYINVTRFHNQSECTRKMKNIALKVDNLTETTRDVTDDFYEELFKDIDGFKQISIRVSHKDLTDLKVQLISLREQNLSVRRLTRQIADLIMAGKLDEAITIFKESNTNIRDEVMRNSVKIIYDESVLQTAILFSYTVGYFDASLAGFKILMNELKQNSRMEDLEVLLLQFCISNDILLSNFASQPTGVKDGYLKLQTEVNIFVEKIIPVLVAEIDQMSYSKRDDVAKRFGDNVLNMFLPRIIIKYCTPGTTAPLTNELFRYIKESSYISSICVAEEALYDEMMKNDQLSSFEAFNHWLFVRNIIKNATNYKNVSDLNTKKCQRVFDAQSDNAANCTSKFITVYDSDDWSEIKNWKQKFPGSLHWILQDVVAEKYKGNVENIIKLEKLIKEINNWGAYCVGYGTLAMEMESHNQFDTFETLFVYKKVKLAIDNYVSKNIDYLYSHFCESAEKIAPAWIRSLIFSETARCFIKNKDDSKVLAINLLSNQKSIIMKSSGSDETRWNIKVDENGLVSFQNIRYPDTYISMTEGEDDLKASSKFWWSVEGSVDGHVRIYAKVESRNDFYFVNQVKESNNGGAQVAKRNACGMMCEWKLVC